MFADVHAELKLGLPHNTSTPLTLPLNDAQPVHLQGLPAHYNQPSPIHPEIKGDNSKGAWQARLRSLRCSPAYKQKAGIWHQQIRASVFLHSEMVGSNRNR